MSDRLDRVLSAIDSGLQSSEETGYTHDRLDRCARCQRIEAVEGGDICAGCRAHLLGDGPEPGVEGVAAWSRTQVLADELWDACAAVPGRSPMLTMVNPDEPGWLMDALAESEARASMSFVAFDAGPPPVGVRLTVQGGRLTSEQFPERPVTFRLSAD